MNAMQKLKELDDSIEKQITALEEVHAEQVEDMLVEEGMKALVLWAKSFPKRDIRFVSGMGTACFACPSVDQSCYLPEVDDLCDASCKMYNWNARAAEMVKPLADFLKLFWGSNLHQYPCLNEIIYNPVTRTIECGDKIIQLDMIQVEVNHG